jgi:transcription elongation factor Elf1
MQVEQKLICPCCAEEVSILLDLSAGGQRYIEDCEVCCNPIEIGYEVNDGEIEDFYSQSIEQ